MTQNAFLASTAFSNITVGSTTVSAVYVGSTKIWEAASGVTWTDPDLSNASYDSVVLPSSGTLQGETNAYGLTFKDDGTAVYYCGVSFDQIASYTLSTAWDLSTASYNNAYSVGSNPRDIHFSSDGTKMFTFHTSGNLIRRHDLSTAWDVSTASLNSNSYTPTVSGQVRGGFLNSDGTELYITDFGNIRSYDLSTGFDLSTASVNATATLITNTYCGGLHLNPDGTKLFGIFGNTIRSYSFSTAYDISTLSQDSDSHVTSSQDSAMNGVAFKTDGSKAYTIGQNSDKIHQYSTAAAAWTNPDLSNASYDSVSFSISSQATFPTGMFFKDDGTKAYVLDNGNDTIYQYALSTAWDVSTASYESKSFNVGSANNPVSLLFPEALSFKSDGTSVYVVDRAADAAYQYTLSTAWDISTASYASKSLDVSPQEINPRAMYFKSDGSKVYIAGTSNDTIYQYALSTAWDVSTGSFETGKSFSVSSQEGSPQSLYFSPSGDKVWTIGTTNQTVYQYSLSTAWDISTASYDSVSFSVSSQDTSPKELFYKSDGSKLYVVGATNDNIYQYST